MTRVKGGTISRARHKKVLKKAEGYFGSKHRLFKSAKEQVMHAGKYAYRDRRQNKRDFRKLWITRINAACRECEISYSKFINGLNKAGITINRKMLSEIAIANMEDFKKMVEIAKAALDGKEYKPVKLAETAEKKKATVKKETVQVEEKPVEKKAVKKTETESKTVKKTATKKATTVKKEAKPTTTKKLVKKETKKVAK